MNRLLLSASLSFAIGPARPLPGRPAARLGPPPRLQSLYADDGGEADVDWDKEAAALAKRGAQRPNPYVEAVRSVELPEMVAEFAKTAPEAVQLAVKQTVAALLGQMPAEVADGAITATGQSLASLFFSMQMTGYMFRNAEYRRSLSTTLAAAEDEMAEAAALPPVKGEITVSLAPGMEAKVDAAAYMAELRSEVEGLRAQLASAREKKAELPPPPPPPSRPRPAPPPSRPRAGPRASGADPTCRRRSSRCSPSSSRCPATRRASCREASPRRCSRRWANLGSSRLISAHLGVSSEVLEAMGQLVTSLLRDMNVAPDALTEAPVAKMREVAVPPRTPHPPHSQPRPPLAPLTERPARRQVLILQLVQGYKLRELEVRAELKGTFWDQ